MGSSVAVAAVVEHHFHKLTRGTAVGVIAPSDFGIDSEASLLVGCKDSLGNSC